MPSDEVEPSYAPDGNSFVFVSNKTGVKTPQIYRYNFATQGIKRISRGGYATSPSFSPDGKQIAFLNGRNASIMNLSGSVIHNIGNTGIDEAPHFSPVVVALGVPLVVSFAILFGQKVQIKVN